MGRVLPFVPRPPAAPRLTVSASEIVAADGYVLIPNPGGEPHRLEAAHALAVAHALQTVALSAAAQLADRKRGKRR